VNHRKPQLFPIAFRDLVRSLQILSLPIWPLAAAGAQEAVQKLRVSTTIPDIADLVKTAGGDAADVLSFTAGPQDPHFLEPKPSFIKELSRADLFIEVGLELEIGWAPVLIKSARNPRCAENGSGFLDLSRAIAPLEIPSGLIDRSAGDIHALGNPHYLLDPLNGLRAARRIRDKLMELAPGQRALFESNHAAFARELALRLLGEKLIDKHAREWEKLLELYDRGGLEKLVEFLDSQQEIDLLGGWTGMLLAHRRRLLIADHNLWPYFSRRFGIEVAGFLEPKPGISPTSKHLSRIIELMKQRDICCILSVPYIPDRHARFVAAQVQAAVVPMAHQCGSRKGTGTYLELMDYNVRQLAAALSRKTETRQPPTKNP
jgi:ABC-type Zn uptake system ZnuABC Zn-binding protein ZnuA